MGKELKQIMVAFVGGMTTFVTIPFFVSPFSFRPSTPKATRKAARPDVSRYFDVTGRYISDACQKFEESHS